MPASATQMCRGSRCRRREFPCHRTDFCSPAEAARQASAPERRLGQSHDVLDLLQIPAAFSWIGTERQAPPAGLKLLSERRAADPSGRPPPYDESYNASRTSEAHHPTRDDVRFRDTGVDRRMAVMGALLLGWFESPLNPKAEGPSAQISVPSVRVRASSTSTPRYLTVLSILVWPSRIWTARKFPVRL